MGTYLNGEMLKIDLNYGPEIGLKISFLNFTESVLFDLIFNSKLKFSKM